MTERGFVLNDRKSFIDLYAVDVKKDELDAALIKGKDARGIDGLLAGKNGRIYLGISKLGISAGTDLYLLASHLEILAHRISSLFDRRI